LTLGKTVFAVKTYAECRWPSVFGALPSALYCLWLVLVFVLCWREEEENRRNACKRRPERRQENEMDMIQEMMRPGVVTSSQGSDPSIDLDGSMLLQPAASY